MENDQNIISKDDVIAKIKDDGDFDNLRLKIIRKLKDDEVLRDKIVSVVKQSAALNRAGAENLKPRQLSDAIHEEVGNKIMGQISDGLWEIIRSDDGVKSEISDTVQSVYDKILNPIGKEVAESSSSFYMTPIPMETDNNGVTTTLANENHDTVSDSEPKEPPGFTLCDQNQNNCEELHREEIQLPLSHEKRPSKKLKEEEPVVSQVVLEPNGVQFNVPPGISSGMEHTEPYDDNGEDPDVPPGFG